MANRASSFRQVQGRDVKKLLHLAAGHRLQPGFDHFVKRPDVVAFAFGEPAMDLHGRKKLVARYVQRESGELFAGIGFNAPVAAEAPPDDFSEIAAPHLAHLGKVAAAGAAGWKVERELGQNTFQLHQGVLTVVEGGVEFARDYHGLVGVRIHHGVD